MIGEGNMILLVEDNDDDVELTIVEPRLRRNECAVAVLPRIGDGNHQRA